MFKSAATVAARAGLRNEALLAHVLGKQRLAERVVNLMGTGVIQVLTL